MTWRPRWAKVWHEVRYCSDACRRRKVTQEDRALELAIVELLGQRDRRATICPSEAARRVRSGDDWAEIIEPARRAARRLVSRGVLQILQKNAVVDPSTAKGPIRLRWVGPWPPSL
jgi:hypothetical protein